MLTLACILCARFSRSWFKGSLCPISFVDDIDRFEAPLSEVVVRCSCLIPETGDRPGLRWWFLVREFMYCADAGRYAIRSGRCKNRVFVQKCGTCRWRIWISFDPIVSGVSGHLLDPCEVISWQSLRVPPVWCPGCRWFNVGCRVSCYQVCVPLVDYRL